jgi:hypothetical protein
MSPKPKFLAFSFAIHLILRPTSHYTNVDWRMCRWDTFSVFALKKSETFMDTALIYSRMCLIRKLKHLCFSTQGNSAMSFPSVPHDFSKLYFWFRSAPAKHRIKLKAFISNFSVNLASLSGLKLGWMIRTYWFVCWRMLSKIAAVMRHFHVSKSVIAFLT